MEQPRAPSGRPPPLTDLLMDVLHDLPGLLTDRIELLSLELNRAGLALTRIIVLAVAAAIFVATAWLSLWGGWWRRWWQSACIGVWPSWWRCC